MSDHLLWFSRLVLSGLVVVLGARLTAHQGQEPSVQKPVPAIKAEVNEVPVPVVVTDAHGHTVGNLTKENFQILDNGKPQIITGFNVIERTAGSSSTAAVARAANSSVASQRAAVGRRYIDLVFDDLNLNPSDLMQSQKAATKLFDAQLPSSDTAAVLSTSGFDSGLTSDNAALQKAIQNLKSRNFYNRIDADCPRIDYYQGDLIENKNDPGALEAATDEVMSCANITSRARAEQMAHQAAQRAVSLGDQDFRFNLNFLRSAVNKMATLQGQRVLVLVSPGFLTPTEEAARLISEVLDMADRLGVTISAIDARGLYTTNLDSSERSSSSITQAREQEQNRPSSMASSENVMAVLADGSGGTYVHNSNDLISGLDALFGGPKFLYMLAFSPQAKFNGRYHVLKVQVNQEGLRLRSRHGYFATKPKRNNQK
jgi:VWFA-related protein